MVTRLRLAPARCGRGRPRSPDKGLLNAKGGAEGGDALAVEIALEIGDECGEVGRSFYRREEGAGGEDGLHLRKVIGVVGAQVNDAAGRKGLMGKRGKLLVDEAVFAMFALGPWIGEINVEGGRRLAGEKPFQHIGRFDADGADIGQIGALAFAFEFSEAAKEALDADEIALRMRGGVLTQERTVAAAKLNFQGLRRGKERRDWKRIGDRRERMNGRRRRSQGGVKRS